MKFEISIIIPAYNEALRITKSLETAVDYLHSNNYSYEIIVVDDGSSDTTSDVVSAFGQGVVLIKQPRNFGKGAAVRRGMLESKGEYKVFSDADFSTPVYELPKILNKLKDGFDICIGSRTVDPALIKEHQPFYREFMGKTFNKIVQLLLFRGISDTQCGFKGFTAKAADLVFNEAIIDGFGFDVEILYLARKKNLSIEQAAVEWYNDERSTVNPVTDSLKMIAEMFKIRKLHGKK
jgi:dolichyl-phosphate beta-glucosyltransferase